LCDSYSLNSFLVCTEENSVWESTAKVDRTEGRLLTLWVGSEAELRKLEQKIVRFLWASHNYKVHHRVNYQTIMRSKSQGGLGSTSIIHQVDSLASKLIIWALSEGEDDLKSILQQRIRDLSYMEWGVADFSWALYRSKALPTVGSLAWVNICKSWNRVKVHLRPKPPVSIDDARGLQIWTPHSLWGDPKHTRC
jgi:hypothetical protein